MPDEQIRLRATTQIRNDYLISAREKLHLTQSALASISGVSIKYISDLERLQFPQNYDINKIEAIAGVLEIPPEWVMPETLTGWKGQTKFQTTAEVKVERLLEYEQTVTKHFLLPSPDETIEDKDDMARLKQMIKSFLSEREQIIINLRYGLTGKTPMTLKQLAKKYGITMESVRTKEVKALRKLQEMASMPYWMNEINKKSIDNIE